MGIGSGWNFTKEVYGTAPVGTPIVAATAYGNVTAGYETWRQVLRLDEGGVVVSTWSGANNAVSFSLFPFPLPLSLTSQNE